MSGVNIIYALLKANAALIAVVPQARMKSGTLPEGIALPAIAIQRVSGVDRNIYSPAATVFVTERVQVTVLARSYTEQSDTIKLIRKACRDQRGTIAGFGGVAVLTDTLGPDDIYGESAGIYLQTQDFKVTYSETP